LNLNEAMQRLSISEDQVRLIFSNNLGLYERFLLKFPQDTSYNALCIGMERNNRFEIENAAHTLKGVSGNLGLDRLYRACDALVCTVRAGGQDFSAIYSELTHAYRDAVTVISGLNA